MTTCPSPLVMTQNPGAAQVTVSRLLRPGPNDRGDDQEVPSKVTAYPASSMATQNVRLAHDADRSPNSPSPHDTGVEDPPPCWRFMLSGSTNRGPDHPCPFQTEA